MNEDTIRKAEEDKVQAVINACAELSSIVYNDQLAQKDEQIKELVEGLEYARRFMTKEQFDLEYIDELIQKYKG